MNIRRIDCSLFCCLEDSGDQLGVLTGKRTSERHHIHQLRRCAAIRARAEQNASTRCLHVLQCSPTGKQTINSPLIPCSKHVLWLHVDGIECIDGKDSLYLQQMRVSR